MIRFIHTADWQIGKVFRQVDAETMALLQNARLDGISRIGDLALREGVSCVLVAGDAFDAEGLSDRTLHQPLERMRAFDAIQWHLIPGNHDPHRPEGLWARIGRGSRPHNVHVHLQPEPVEIAGSGAWLLPAVLRQRGVTDDPTAFMDHMATPAGAVRIGLAHGSITSFGSGAEQHNLIDPARPRRAGLSYLALGDWHSFKRINERCYYAGTHETDGFGVADGGHVALVDIADASATPSVRQTTVGHYHWRTIEARVHDSADIDGLINRARGIDFPLERVLLRLKLQGVLSLAARARLDAVARQSLAAALCYLRLDLDAVAVRPSANDLEAIGSGPLRAAAENLRQIAADPDEARREFAQYALERLYVERLKLTGR